ncbi:MAG: hypothetical protein AAF628_20340 [Planctomycetota bacterium]
MIPLRLRRLVGDGWNGKASVFVNAEHALIQICDHLLSRVECYAWAAVLPGLSRAVDVGHEESRRALARRMWESDEDDEVVQRIYDDYASCLQRNVEDAKQRAWYWGYSSEALFGEHGTERFEGVGAEGVKCSWTPHGIDSGYVPRYARLLPRDDGSGQPDDLGEEEAECRRRSERPLPRDLGPEVDTPHIDPSDDCARYSTFRASFRELQREYVAAHEETGDWSGQFLVPEPCGLFQLPTAPQWQALVRREVDQP